MAGALGIDGLLGEGGEVGADDGERLNAVFAAEAAGDLLLELGCWDLSDLAPGAAGTVTVTVDVSGTVDDGAECLNEVTLTSDQAEVTATQATRVEREPVLSRTKTDTGPGSAGAKF